MSALVVHTVERNGPSGVAVDEMGIDAVRSSFLEKVDDLDQAVEGRFTADPLSLHRHDGRHDPEAGAADRARLRAERSFGYIGLAVRLVDVIQIKVCPDRIAPLSRHAAVRMGIVPEIPEGLALHGPPAARHRKGA